jgi:uncharacterized membrane protein YtjA (UPF0391 family)
MELRIRTCRIRQVRSFPFRQTKTVARTVVNGTDNSYNWAKLFSRVRGCEETVVSASVKRLNLNLEFRGGLTMLRWAIIFLVVALVAAVFGFGGIAGTAAGIAKILFFLFLVLFVLALIFGRSIFSPQP